MLVERGILDETSAGFSYLGILTEDILEILKEDFPSEHRQLVAVLRTRDLYHRIETVMDDSDKADWENGGGQVQEALREELVRDASDFNKRLKSARGRSYTCPSSERVFVPRNTQYIAPRSYTRRGKYPVAVLPGQYTDGVIRYTSEELFTMPLGTPLMHNEREEEGEEEDVSVVNKTLTPIKKPENNMSCEHCDSDIAKSEKTVRCNKCKGYYHAKCIGISKAMLKTVSRYPWDCPACKMCDICDKPDGK